LNGELKEDELPRDVLTVLLRNQDSIELTDELIEREISFYLQAGSHSTANSMVHAVNEIFSWADEPTALLEDPLLLQKCVHESMRLHPASPVAWRTPTEPITIASRDITPDDLLILDLHAANRDPDIFGDETLPMLRLSCMGLPSAPASICVPAATWMAALPAAPALIKIRTSMVSSAC